MTKNLFLQLCEELHIPHTLAFTNRIFEECSYKYDFSGLPEMIEDYRAKRYVGLSVIKPRTK